MPIGGFVVTVLPDHRDQVAGRVEAIEGAEVYGWDDKGNLVVVIETETSDDMERLVDEIKEYDGVVSVGLAYLYFEDEVEKIERGEIKPEIPRRKN